MSKSHGILPFAALIYDSARAGELDHLIAPPYDLIDRELQSALYERSPFNIVRIELNASGDPYEDAATTIMRWRRRGVLYQVAHPGFYLYSQRFRHRDQDLERRGIIARVRLEEFASGRILPHERTFPKAKEDRLQLLEATRTNLSSIFGLYGSSPHQLKDLLAVVALRKPDMVARDDSGVVHEIRFIETPAETTAIQAALNGQRIFIADGHHRYETALEYRRRRRQSDSAANVSKAYDFVMMTLVAFDDPGLVILPTHRLVRRLPSHEAQNFESWCRDLFQVETFSNPDQFLAALRAHGRGHIGVGLKNSTELRLLSLKSLDSIAHALPEVPPALRELDVSILHALIFARIFGIQPEDVRKGDNIEYTIDAEQALREVAAGSADGAFLMNPPTAEDIARVSESGAIMPEKSTYFFPKLATGLIMNPVED
jgi:uncharacterized protein (DUF1015 family)